MSEPSEGGAISPDAADAGKSTSPSAACHSSRRKVPVDVPTCSPFPREPCQARRKTRAGAPVPAPPRRAGGGVTFRAGGHATLRSHSQLDEPPGPLAVMLTTGREAVRRLPVDFWCAPPAGKDRRTTSPQKGKPDFRSFSSGRVIQQLQAVLHDAGAPKRQIRRAWRLCSTCLRRFLSLSCSPVEEERKQAREKIPRV
jgi:hypothetical protein